MSTHPPTRFPQSVHLWGSWPPFRACAGETFRDQLFLKVSDFFHGGCIYSHWKKTSQSRFKHSWQEDLYVNDLYVDENELWAWIPGICFWFNEVSGKFHTLIRAKFTFWHVYTDYIYICDTLRVMLKFLNLSWARRRTCSRFSAKHTNATSLRGVLFTVHISIHQFKIENEISVWYFSCTGYAMYETWLFQ